MQKKPILSALAAVALLPQAVGLAQQTPMTGRTLMYVWREEPKPAKGAVIITAEEIQKVLDSPGGDHQAAIVDVGSFNLCVGALRNRPNPNPNPTPQASAQRPATQSEYPVLPCGASTGALSGASGISHYAEVETYVIIRGTATSVTGGQIINGRVTTPESEQTRVLNGPSCGGAIGGEGVQKRTVKAGDVVMIPQNTPHGWLDVKEQFDYILVRQDLDHNLPAGYIHPSIRDGR